MGEIIQGIIDLASASTYKYEEKYQYLLGKLQNCGLITRENGNIHPTPNQSKIDIIYIQPQELEEDDSKNTIYYETLADSISRCYQGSELIERFASSISQWSKD